MAKARTVARSWRERVHGSQRKTPSTVPRRSESRQVLRSLNTGDAIGRMHTPAESPPRGSRLPSSQGHGFGSRPEFLRSSVLLARVKNKLTIKVEHTCHQFSQFANGYVLTSTDVDEGSLTHTEKRIVNRLRQVQEMQTCLSEVITIEKLPPGRPVPQTTSFFSRQLAPRPFALKRVKRVNPAGQNCLQVRTGLSASPQGTSCHTAGCTTSTFQYRQFWLARRPDSWVQAVP